MENKYKGRKRIIVIFSALFLVIATLLLLIFNEGKKSYTVEFDLDGGTLLSGSLVQEIRHGQDAIPPTVVKDGAYLHSWSGSYQRVTKNVTVKAVWEYNTTAGIIYSESENQNYTEIEGAYKYLQGEVYLGAYYDKKQVLGICDGAFSDCTGITKVYLLDGLLQIGAEAFSGCTSLTEIEIPETVVRLGDGVFRGCESLETLILNEGLKEIGAGAFEGCASLEKIIIPSTVISIDEGAFRDCESLKTVVFVEAPEKTDEEREGS